MTISDPSAQTIAAIEELRSLPANWDSYGSPPIPDEAIQEAGRVARFAIGHGFPAPHVVPIRGGGVQLEWQIGSKELELEVTPSATIEYLAAAGDETREGTFPASRRADIERLLNWLIATR